MKSICGVMLCAALAALPIEAAPEPSAFPTTWQLDFEFDDLARIDVVLPGDAEPTTFWYLRYTVTNNTGADRDFFPSVDLVTDRLEVVTAGDAISPTVHDVLAARFAKLHPFFRDPAKVSGRLLQGPDNARTTAAVFRDFDKRASQVTIYLAGLSGEMARVMNPEFDRDEPESAENPRFFPLRKTLAIRYDIPGDPQTRSAATPVRRLRTWVMR